MTARGSGSNSVVLEAMPARACAFEPRERALWLAVLTNALTDINLGRHPGRREDALRWIGSADFRAVCDLAGLDPDWVAAGVRKRLTDKTKFAVEQRLAARKLAGEAGRQAA